MTADTPAVDANDHRSAAWLTDDALLEFAVVITRVLVAIHTEGTPRFVVLPLVLLGGVWSRARAYALLWVSIGAVRAVGEIPYAWYAIDNHQYLPTYWCLALGIALLLREPRSAIHMNARLLVGLAFAFATLWKLISRDFFDATFFHFTLLVDGRFGAVTQAIGGPRASWPARTPRPWRR